MVTVKADVDPLPYCFVCPECRTEVDSCVDLEDFANLSFGVTLDETCPECNADFKVEIL